MGRVRPALRKFILHASLLRWLFGVTLLHLSGCASVSSPVFDILSGSTMNPAEAREKDISSFKADPRFDFLRVDVSNRSAAVLILGSVEAHPGGEVKVWYSGLREVIKTQNGRIIGTYGLEVDWFNVVWSPMPPAWSAVGSQEIYFQRVHDEMPGYRYAVSDQVELKRWHGVPPIKLPVSLPPELAAKLTWFSETSVSSTHQALPTAWYAWGVHQGRPAMIYSEQCLSVTFCLKLQLWPAQESAS